MSPDTRRARVFGLGLNKTGTSSLHEALTILGYDSLHWGGPEIRRKVEAALEAGAPLLSNLEARHDAFSDILALSTNYSLLDEQYPGSRFVLTVRPVDAWVDSRRRHVERNLELAAAGEYTGTFLVVDEPGWRREWDAHVTGVREYFAGRDDFLELDVTATPTWDALCALLHVEPPAVPFPWKNRDRAHSGSV